jgi:hypothetical protein
MPIRFKNYVQIGSYQQGGFGAQSQANQGNLPQGGVAPQILQMVGDPAVPTWVYAPVDLTGAYSPGLLTADQVVMSFTAKHLLGFSANAFEITFDAPAAAAQVFRVIEYLTGTQIGTLTVAMGAKVTASALGAFQADPEDVVRILAPHVPDATLAGAQASATAVRLS